MVRIFSATFLAKFRNPLIRKLNQIINGCDISHKCTIGENFQIPHNGTGTVVGGGVVIGDNVKIGSNCILGYHKGYPKIGDNVTIFPNSIIIGNITIGKNSIIGAGTYVDKDVPPNSVVYNKKELIIKLRSEQ